MKMAAIPISTETVIARKGLVNFNEVPEFFLDVHSSIHVPLAHKI